MKEPNGNQCVYRGCENAGEVHWIPVNNLTHIYRLCAACLEKVRSNWIRTSSYRVGNLKHITECFLDSETLLEDDDVL